MDYALIKKIVKLVEESQITEFEYEESETRIRVSKEVKFLQSAAAPLPIAPALGHIPAHTEMTAPKELADAFSTADSSATPANLHEVKSPIVGTFYCSPSPNAPPFVRVGDSVTVGQALCIIEAMKLMNEIESDVNGKIVKTLVENGSPVEFNQPLFIVEL
jgi:acetyl-CoA carboxylase biotin carboxyl carrier protein